MRLSAFSSGFNHRKKAFPAIAGNAETLLSMTCLVFEPVCLLLQAGQSFFFVSQPFFGQLHTASAD
ncbi:hypothetical protein D3C75_1333780 [compost metagenome]